jgi:hypothetical protein
MGRRRRELQRGNMSFYSGETIKLEDRARWLTMEHLWVIRLPLPWLSTWWINSRVRPWRKGRKRERKDRLRFCPAHAVTLADLRLVLSSLSSRRSGSARWLAASARPPVAGPCPRPPHSLVVTHIGQFGAHETDRGFNRFLYSTCESKREAGGGEVTICAG